MRRQQYPWWCWWVHSLHTVDNIFGCTAAHAHHPAHIFLFAFDMFACGFFPCFLKHWYLLRFVLSIGDGADECILLPHILWHTGAHDQVTLLSLVWKMIYDCLWSWCRWVSTFSEVGLANISLSAVLEPAAASANKAVSLHLTGECCEPTAAIHLTCYLHAPWASAGLLYGSCPHPPWTLVRWLYYGLKGDGTLGWISGLGSITFQFSQFKVVLNLKTEIPF